MSDTESRIDDAPAPAVTDRSAPPVDRHHTAPGDDTPEPDPDATAPADDTQQIDEDLRADDTPHMLETIEVTSTPRSTAVDTPVGAVDTEEVARRRAARSRPSVPVTPTDADAVRAPQLDRRGRVSKWDRPPPPHDWRWYVGNLGKTLIAVGILMFGFVAYQLWGTGIENAASQRALSNEFEELLESVEPITFDPVDAAGSTVVVEAPGENGGDPEDVTAATTDETTSDTTDETTSDTTDDTTDDGAAPEVEATAPDAEEAGTAPPPEQPVEVVPVEEQNIPLVENGDAIARLEIPAIGADDIVVAGVDIGDLKRGPGHFPDTPLPGQLGNAAIAGHRTTWGQPFHDVDDLEVGDELRVTTLNGVYVYRVTGLEIVAPSEYQVVATTDPTVSNLTLISCHPKWTSQQRIVVFSELDAEASAALGEPVLNYGRPAEPVVAEVLPGEPGEVADDVAVVEPEATDGVSGALLDRPVAATPEELVSPQVDQEIADAFSKGWFSDPSANPHVGFWGLVLAAIAVLSYLVSRRLRRDWVGLMVGVIPFVVTLYFFFQNVNRLLPPNI